jgi:hypothetical protein
MAARNSGSLPSGSPVVIETPSPNAFLAAGFLRSAVVIDDQFVDLEIEVLQPPTTPEADPTLSDQAPLNPPARSPLDEVPNAGLPVEAVTRSFASRGIVCGAFRPSPEIMGDAAVMAATKNADLVILDWNLYKDGGSRARELITELVKARADEWLVIVVYTFFHDEPLERIAAKVAEAVRAGTEREAVLEDRTVRAAGVTVHVVAKEPSHGERGAGVRPDDLADYVINLFARGTEGLLPSVALAGLTAVRSEALAVLRAFNPSMDAAYIGHRLLMYRPDDAEDQLIALLAAEFLDAMRRKRVGEQAEWVAVRRWLEGHGIQSVANVPQEWWDKVFVGGSPPGGDRLDVLLRVLRDGASNLSPRLLLNEKKAHLHATRLFAGLDAAAALESDTKFAEFMELERDPPNVPPRLGLGTLLHTAAGYCVSLQPACDSIRLTVATGFPLVPLGPAREDLRFDVIVDDKLPDEAEPATTKRLVTPSKFGAVQLRMFVPDAGSQAVLAQREGDAWTFSEQPKPGGEPPTAYRYVATLREHQALRLARRFADRLARLGLDESEWARRQAPSESDS